MKTTYELLPGQIEFFNKNGYLVIEDIISKEELKNYRNIYDDFLNGTIDTGKNRTDLGIGLGNNK